VLRSRGVSSSCSSSSRSRFSNTPTPHPAGRPASARPFQCGVTKHDLTCYEAHGVLLRRSCPGGSASCACMSPHPLVPPHCSSGGRGVSANTHERRKRPAVESLRLRLALGSNRTLWFRFNIYATATTGPATLPAPCPGPCCAPFLNGESKGAASKAQQHAYMPWPLCSYSPAPSIAGCLAAAAERPTSRSLINQLSMWYLLGLRPAGPADAGQYRCLDTPTAAPLPRNFASPLKWLLNGGPRAAPDLGILIAMSGMSVGLFAICPGSICTPKRGPKFNRGGVWPPDGARMAIRRQLPRHSPVAFFACTPARHSHP
jgi:hypothetical protein